MRLLKCMKKIVVYSMTIAMMCGFVACSGEEERLNEAFFLGGDEDESTSENIIQSDVMETTTQEVVVEKLEREMYEEDISRLHNVTTAMNRYMGIWYMGYGEI